MFARDLAADLTVGRQPVGIAEHVVEREIQLELTRRVLMVALDDVEAHGAANIRSPS